MSNPTKGHYEDYEYTTPDQFKKWIDRYYFNSAELQNLTQNNVSPIQVFNFDLSSAVTSSSPQQLITNGYGFALYTYTTSSSIKAVVVDSLVNVRINENREEYQLPLKHQRGFRGTFFQLYLNWPAQSGVSADLVIFRFDERAWQNGQEAS